MDSDLEGSDGSAEHGRMHEEDRELDREWQARKQTFWNVRTIIALACWRMHVQRCTHALMAYQSPGINRGRQPGLTTMSFVCSRATVWALMLVKPRRCRKASMKAGT